MHSAGGLMAACEDCDQDVEQKNAAGHYRDRCENCVDAIADGIPSHHEQCDDPDCLICDDYHGSS